MPNVLLTEGGTVALVGWFALDLDLVGRRHALFRLRLTPHPRCWRCACDSWYPRRPLEVAGALARLGADHARETVALRRGQAFAVDRWFRVRLLGIGPACVGLALEPAAWAHCLWCGVALARTRVVVSNPDTLPQEAASCSC